MTTSDVVFGLAVAWLVDGDEVALQACLDALDERPDWSYPRVLREQVLRNFRNDHRMVSCFREAWEQKQRGINQ